MLQTQTLILTYTARLATAVIAGLFGLLLLYVVAFAGSNVLHNVAHDTRHAIVAPCH